MSMEQTQGYCVQCQRPSLFGRPAVNHLIHAIVSIVFFPWVLVWIFATFFRRPVFRCQTCGTDLDTILVPDVSARKRRTYRLLGLFLGGLGVHNFYIGRWQIGVIQALFGIACIVELAGGGPVDFAPGLIFFLVCWILIEVLAVRRDAVGSRLG